MKSRVISLFSVLLLFLVFSSSINNLESVASYSINSSSRSISSISVTDYELSRAFIPDKNIQDFFKNNFGKYLIEVEFDVNGETNIWKKPKNELAEATFFRLLKAVPEFKNKLQIALTSAPKRGPPISKTIINKLLKELYHIKPQLENQFKNGIHNELVTPIELTSKGKGYRNLKLVVNHDILIGNGQSIKKGNLTKNLIDFIRKTKEEIWINVYDFDLKEIATELVALKKAGKQVHVGIHSENVQQKEGVKEVYNILKKGGVDVRAVEFSELSHQKIISRDPSIKSNAAVLFSSGNFTYSGIHPDGDLGELGLKHVKSLPNANHAISFNSYETAQLIKHQIKKVFDLKFKTPSKFPIDGIYKVWGPVVRGRRTSMTLAFSPETRGLINRRLVAKSILEEKVGSPIYISQFSFSDSDIEKAIFDKIKSDYNKTKEINFRFVGDILSSSQDWSPQLRMIGYDRVKLHNENYFKRIGDKSNSWRKAIPRKYDELIDNVRINNNYSRKSVIVGEKNYAVDAKAHHKLFATYNFSSLGSSFNFSASAENNMELFVLLDDPNMATKARGIVNYLYSEKYGGQRLKDRLDGKNEGVLEKLRRNLGEEITLPDEKLASSVTNKSYKRSVNPRSSKLLFDIDDNILYLNSNIRIYHEETGEELLISTNKYAEIRKLVGNKGVKNNKYANYKVEPESFSDFRTTSDKNNFLKTLKESIGTRTEKSWQGPMFSSLVEALNNEESAKNVYFITARGHRRENILEAFKFLQEKGYIKYLPLVDHIWPVTSPDLIDYYSSSFGGEKIEVVTPDNISPSKLKILNNLIGEMENIDVSESASVLSPDNPYVHGKYHTVQFSDDDPKTFSLVKDYLQGRIDSGNFENIKIILHYTNKSQPKSIVLRSGKPPRPVMPIEMSEWKYTVNFSAKQKSCFKVLKNIIN